MDRKFAMKTGDFCCFNSLSKKSVNDSVGRIPLLPQVQWFFSTCPEALIIAQDQTRNLPTHLDRISKGFRLPPKVRILSAVSRLKNPQKLPTLLVIWFNCLLYPKIQQCSIPVSSVNLQEGVVGAYSTGTHMARSSGTKVTTSLHNCWKRKRIPKQLRSECPPSITEDPFLKPSTTLCLPAFRDAIFLPRHLHNILTYSSARALDRPSNMPAAKLEIATIINATPVDSLKSLRQPSRLAKPMGTVSSQSLGTKACCFSCASWTRERKSTTTCKFSSASSIMEMCPECGNLRTKTLGRLGVIFRW